MASTSADPVPNRKNRNVDRPEPQILLVRSIFQPIAGFLQPICYRFGAERSLTAILFRRRTQTAGSFFGADPSRRTRFSAPQGPYQYHERQITNNSRHSLGWQVARRLLPRLYRLLLRRNALVRRHIPRCRTPLPAA